MPSPTLDGLWVRRIRRIGIVAGVAAAAGCQADSGQRQTAIWPHRTARPVYGVAVPPGSVSLAEAEPAARPVATGTAAQPAGRGVMTAGADSAGPIASRAATSVTQVALAQAAAPPVGSNAGSLQPEFAPPPGQPTQPAPGRPESLLPQTPPTEPFLPGIGSPGTGLPGGGLSGGGSAGGAGRTEGSGAGTARRPAADETGPPLGLRDAVAVGLMQNPDLVTIRGTEDVSAAAVGVAKTYPWNPFVQSQFRPQSFGQSQQFSNFYVWVMQRIELAHQTDYRKQNAVGLLNQVRWNIRQAELANVAATMRLYLTAVYLKDIYDLTRETADLNDRLLGVVERRFEANLATASAVTTVRVAARQSRRQADLAEAASQAGALALRQQLSLSSGEPFTLGERLADFDWQPVYGYETPDGASGAASSQFLAAGLIEGRPDVMAASAGIDAVRATMRLADAARIQDIQAGPIYNTNTNNSSDLGFRVQMDLPIWNNGTPLLRQRQAELRQQCLVREQLKRRATIEAQTAIERYDRARQLAGVAGANASGPGADAAADLRQILAQFEAGQADILTVFAAQNDVLRDRRTTLDLLNEVAQSAAGVVLATALPPDRLLAEGVPLSARASQVPPAPAPAAEPAPPAS